MDIPEEYILSISDLKKEINGVIKNLEQLEKKKVVDRIVKQKATKHLCHHKSESDGISCICMYKAADRNQMV